MQFNSETNGLDLYSDARYLCGIDETSDTTSYPIKAFTRNCNIALDRIESLILKADGYAVYDDANQTGELLDVTTNLANGTQKYAISLSWLKVARIRVKDAQGNLKTIPEVPRKNQTDSQLTATSGTPQSYFRLGNYIYLDKAPNYSSTGGFEVQYQRGASYFIFSDTTKVPGFATQFHPLVSAHAALKYCTVNDMPKRIAAIQGIIGSPPDIENGQPGSGLEKELVDYYSARDTDKQPNLSPKKEDYGQNGMVNTPSSANPYGF